MKTITGKDFNELEEELLSKYDNLITDDDIISSIYLISSIRFYINEILFFERLINKELITFNGNDMMDNVNELYKFFLYYKEYIRQNPEYRGIDNSIISSIIKAIETLLDYVGGNGNDNI